MDKRASPPPPMLVVAAALVDAGGRVLVQQRPPGKSLAGLWEFPGGKIEPGETPEAALIREIDEELGIAITADALTPIAFSTLGEGDRPLVLRLFGCSRWVGSAMPLDAAALAWCAPDDLPALAMPRADVPLIAPLRRWISAA